MPKILTLEGLGVEDMSRELQNLQTMLGIPEIGDVLAFCVNITSTVVENSRRGLQLGFYDATTHDVLLYDSRHLTTLLELSKETTVSAPEDPPPD